MNFPNRCGKTRYFDTDRFQHLAVTLLFHVSFFSILTTREISRKRPRLSMFNKPSHYFKAQPERIIATKYLQIYWQSSRRGRLCFSARSPSVKQSEQKSRPVARRIRITSHTSKSVSVIYKVI